MYSRILYKGNSLIIRATFIMNSWIILYRCKEEIQHFFFNTKFVSQEYFYIFEFKHQIFRHWNCSRMLSKKEKKKYRETIFIETEFQKSLKLIDSDKQIYIYFSSISIILAVLLEALRDISLFPSLRKPTHSHVLHRNKTFNSRIHAFIYGIRCIRTCKIYIYIAKKKTSNILLCLFPRTKFCNSDYSSWSFVCRLICVNRARSCTPSCKPRLGKAIKKERERERGREREESRNWSICFMPGFRIGWKCQKWTGTPDSREIYRARNVEWTFPRALKI